MNHEINDIERQIHDLLTPILVPLRRKEINEEAFNQLFQLLERLKELIQSEDYISRSLAGLLFLIYTQVSLQAKFTQYPDPINQKNAIISNFIRHIFKYMV